GSSGGAYTSLQIADAFPGLFDGVLVNAVSPDALSIALAGADAHLLTHYFAEHSGACTDAQQPAVTGYSGLNALAAPANQSDGTAPQQVVDLNERIGGYDQDANYVGARSVGDAGAIRRAYQAGLTLGGGGGLKSIPVFDDGAYNDERGYHYQWFHFAIRERIAKQNGGAANHARWRGPVQA